jgi:hypothetical protein
MPVTTAQRDQLASLIDWLYANRQHLRYPPIINGQIHRTQTVHDLTSVSKFKARVLAGATWDCSQTCYALLGAIFGAKVPNRDGATGSMFEDFPHYSDPRKAYPGALAVYGPGSGHHVVIVRHRDAVHGDPITFSHGSDPAKMISLLTEARFQPHPITMLSIAHL